MKRETLAEYLLRITREENLSGYAIERASGGQLSQSYFNRLKNGSETNPSVPIIEALAKGIGRPFEELLAVVRGKDPNDDKLADERFVALHFTYKGIGKKKRERADQVLQMLERELKRIEAEPE